MAFLSSSLGIYGTDNDTKLSVDVSLIGARTKQTVQFYYFYRSSNDTEVYFVNMDYE